MDLHITFGGIVFHITAPRKLSTLLEGDPYNFKWKIISGKNFETEEYKRLWGALL